MTKQSRNELIVGLVFFGAMTFLGVYTIIISGLFKGPQKTYWVSFPKIYGLKKGDTVRVEGLDQGEVVKLGLIANAKGDERITAELKVSSDVEIYRDASEVKVTPFSPLGGRIVEIKRGFDGPRGKYESVEEARAAGKNEPEMIQGKAEGELLVTLNELVEENRPGIARIVSNLAFVSQQLTRSDNVIGALINDQGTGSELQTIARELGETAIHLNSILRRIDEGEGVIGELVARESALHANVNAAADHARKTLKNAEDILANANEGRSALGVLVSDQPELATKTKQIVSDIALMTSGAAHGEGSLGKFIRDDRFYNGAAATAENLGEITGAIRSPDPEKRSAVGVLVYDPEGGRAVRSTLQHLESITGSIENQEGALGLFIKDKAFQKRIQGIFAEVERLTVEFRDSVEDLREQAPVNAFLGAVFASF